jgi:hypothetical protein
MAPYMGDWLIRWGHFIKDRVNADLASTSTLQNSFPLASPSEMLNNLTILYIRYSLLSTRRVSTPIGSCTVYKVDKCLESQAVFC